MQRGIKTQYDRDAIEYRPVLQYEKKQGSLINNILIPDEYAIDEEIQSIISRLPSNTTAEMLMFYSDMTKAIEEVEEIVIETPAIPDETQSEAVSKAAATLDIDISRGVTYDTYKKLYEDPHKDDYDKQVILSTWESFHAGISGSIAGEYYTDLLRMREDVNNLMDFWSRAVIQYIDSDLVVNASSESTLPNLEKSERESVDRLLIYKKSIDDIKKELRGIMVKSLDPEDPENIRIDKLENKQKQLQKEYDSIIRQYHVACEVGDIIKKKVNINGYAVRLMRQYVRYTPQNAYSGNLVDCIMGLVQGLVKENFLIRLKQLRVLLRYSFDQKSEDIYREKQKNEAVFDNRVKKALQDTCVRDIGIKVGVCHPLMQALKDVPDASATFMEQMAQVFLDGIQSAEHQYRNNITQLFGAHANSARSEVYRTNHIYDKQNVRDIYGIITMMINHIEYGGSTPNQHSLRGWIIALLESAGLNNIYDYEAGDVIQLRL